MVGNADAWTLVSEEPDTLCVNFDPEVTQLIREAKVLRRLGVAVPDMADTILMQVMRTCVGFPQRIDTTMPSLVSAHMRRSNRG